MKIPQLDFHVADNAEIPHVSIIEVETCNTVADIPCSPDPDSLEAAAAIAEHLVKRSNAHASLLAVLHLAETLNSRQHAGMKITPTMWSELYARSNEARALVGS